MKFGTSATATLEAEYEFLGEIGRGGMGVVYLARDREDGREVAIKVMNARYRDDPEANARFAREARTVAALDHPNIVTVHAVRELGEHGLALVMERIQGQSVREEIARRSRLSFHRAGQIFRDVAEALAHAHARGIVHRDVKPENIFLDETDGRALLSDFGIARLIATDTDLTMTGMAIGTPTYMSPEQIDGTGVDGRSDLYSLGLVGWQMLTGERPWEGQGLFEVIYRQKSELLPPLDSKRSRVPPRLRIAIEGCLLKEPDGRWASADEMLEWLTGDPSVTSPRGREIIAAIAEARQREARAESDADATIVFKRPVALTAPPGKPADRPAEPRDPPADSPVRPEVVGVEPAAPRPLATTGLDPDEIAELEPVAPPRRPLRRVVLAAALLLLVGALGLRAVLGPDRLAEQAAGETGAARTDITAGAAAGEVGQAIPLLADSGAAGMRMGDSLAAAGSDPFAVAGGDVGDAIGALAPADSAPLPPVQQPVQQPPAAAPEPAPPVVAATPPPERAGASVPADSGAATTPAATTPAEPVAAPVARVAPSGSPALALGGLHSCFLARGRAYCWGANDRGQLGDASTTRHSTPAAVTSLGAVSFLAAGLAHSCAVARDGATYCWGANSSGQLGNGSTTPHTAPVAVAGDHGFRVVRVGQSHSCGLTGAGAVMCWGDDSYGQLGVPADGGSPVPVAVAANSSFQALALGWNHACALDEAGRAWCWGRNDFGQLGDGTLANRGEPRLVGGGRSFVAIAAGASHSCALTAAGDAFCWGRNSAGQLGDGGTANRLTPVRVRGQGGFASIAAGSMHSCAVTTGGDAFCWGQNGYGQLGNDGTSSSAVPVQVHGDHRFASIAASGAHSCGTTPSGESFCWGYNVEGQLGDGTRANRRRPVYVERP